MAGDELDHYMQSGRMSVSDPIAYWFVQLPSPLARMALDILTMPGLCSYNIVLSMLIYLLIASSVDVERAFSRGGLTVSKLRHSLGDESVRAATVLASWANSGIESLLPEDQLIEHIKGKAKRPTKPLVMAAVIKVDDSDSSESSIE